MVKIITSNNIEEMLKNPSNYVDDDQDVALLKVYGSDVSNPTTLMVGVNEEDQDCKNAGPWYIVEKDNGVSKYHYCFEKNLYETYEKVLVALLKEVDR